MEHHVHVMALRETRWTGRDIDGHFPNYQWFGRKSKAACGGVGILVHHSVLLQTRFKVIKGEDSNSIFLHLSPSADRHILFAAVYGKSGPTKQESQVHWKAYQNDVTG